MFDCICQWVLGCSGSSEGLKRFNFDFKLVGFNFMCYLEVDSVCMVLTLCRDLRKPDETKFY